MNEFIEKLIKRLEEIPVGLVCGECPNILKCNEIEDSGIGKNVDLCGATTKQLAIEIVNQLAEEYNNGWIPCNERLPQVETEVLIFARRKYTGGHFKDIITTAMYEDGTVLENDSCWRWEDIEGEWNEEEDCYIIPEGWWENRHYNPDDVYNNLVDDKVIAWQPLPAPYQPKGE